MAGMAGPFPFSTSLVVLLTSHTAGYNLLHGTAVYRCPIAGYPIPADVPPIAQAAPLQVSTWIRKGPTGLPVEPIRQHGGAGNRTPVRASIQNCVYVRRPLLRSPPTGVRPAKSADKRPFKSRTSRGCSAPRQPDFPIPARRLRRAATRAGALSAVLTQPEPSQYWQLCVSQCFDQGTGVLDTQQNLH